MIFLMLAAIVYLVGIVGYYKMVTQNEGLNLEKSPMVICLSVLIACMWPLIVIWSLVVEASK